MRGEWGLVGMGREGRGQGGSRRALIEGSLSWPHNGANSSRYRELKGRKELSSFEKGFSGTIGEAIKRGALFPIQAGKLRPPPPSPGQIAETPQGCDEAGGSSQSPAPCPATQFPAGTEGLEPQDPARAAGAAVPVSLQPGMAFQGWHSMERCCSAPPHTPNPPGHGSSSHPLPVATGGPVSPKATKQEPPPQHSIPSPKWSPAGPTGTPEHPSFPLQLSVFFKK